MGDCFAPLGPFLLPWDLMAQTDKHINAHGDSMTNSAELVKRKQWLIWHSYRQLYTPKTVLYSQDRCWLPRQFQTVKTIAGSCKLSRQIYIAADQWRHVCSSHSAIQIVSQNRGTIPNFNCDAPEEVCGDRK